MSAAGASRRRNLWKASAPGTSPSHLWTLGHSLDFRGCLSYQPLALPVVGKGGCLSAWPFPSLNLKVDVSATGTPRRWKMGNGLSSLHFPSLRFGGGLRCWRAPSTGIWGRPPLLAPSQDLEANLSSWHFQSLRVCRVSQRLALPSWDFGGCRSSGHFPSLEDRNSF